MLPEHSGPRMSMPFLLSQSDLKRDMRDKTRKTAKELALDHGWSKEDVEYRFATKEIQEKLDRLKPWFDAIRAGDLATLRELLKKDANLVNAQERTTDRMTSTMVALYCERNEVIDFLKVQEGWDPKVKDAKKRTIAQYAYDKCGFPSNEYALFKNGERMTSIAIKLDEDDSILLKRVNNGLVGDVEKLIEKGEKLDVQSKTDGYTALMIALSRGDKKMVTLLLDKGANHGLKSNADRSTRSFARDQPTLTLFDKKITPLAHWKEKIHDLPALDKAIKDGKVDLSGVNDEGKTAREVLLTQKRGIKLMQAYPQHFPFTVVDDGAPQNGDGVTNPVDQNPTETMKSAAVTALRTLKPKAIAGYLDDDYFKVNERLTGDESTPLIIAATANRIDVVKVLLENKADPTLRRNDRKTALECTTDLDIQALLRTALQNWEHEDEEELDDDPKGNNVDEEEELDDEPKRSLLVVSDNNDEEESESDEESEEEVPKEAVKPPPKRQLASRSSSDDEEESESDEESEEEQPKEAAKPPRKRRLVVSNSSGSDDDKEEESGSDDEQVQQVVRARPVVQAQQLVQTQQVVQARPVVRARPVVVQAVHHESFTSTTIETITESITIIETPPPTSPRATNSSLPQHLNKNMVLSFDG